MIIRKRHLNIVAIVFFAVVIAVVFQQIATSMTEQGIASGGPYDNAAAYPRAISVLIGILLVCQLAASFLMKSDEEQDDDGVDIGSLGRPAAMLAVFAGYLGLLNWLGYHLTTPIMLFAIMWIAGMRRMVLMVISALAMSLFFAFMFEFFLKIVLPGGVFRLNIPWS
ncbi:MAG: tripartite tricarboxylate transporter TctB family protein [Pseudomonadota bacterium]